MGRKKSKDSEHRRQKRLMRKRGKDSVRHKSQSSASVSENAVQHQMLSEFGSVENFVKNTRHLAELFKTEEGLKELRFDHKAVYAKLDAEDPKTNEALKDLFTDDDFTYYAEEYEDFWKEKRSEILPDLLTEEIVNKTSKLFKVLIRKKRGFKQDYRAVMAGELLIQSHLAALTEAPVGENNLWEIMFNAALKENKIDLPEPRPETEEEKDSGADSPEPETETEEEKDSEADSPESEIEGEEKDKEAPEVLPAVPEKGDVGDEEAEPEETPSDQEKDES